MWIFHGYVSLPEITEFEFQSTMPKICLLRSASVSSDRWTNTLGRAHGKSLAFGSFRRSKNMQTPMSRKNKTGSVGFSQLDFWRCPWISMIYGDSWSWWFLVIFSDLQPPWVIGSTLAFLIVVLHVYSQKASWYYGDPRVTDPKNKNK